MINVRILRTKQTNAKINFDVRMAGINVMQVGSMALLILVSEETMDIGKYFAKLNLSPSKVKSIEADRTRLNCYDVGFKTEDGRFVPVGPFSGETLNALIQYWTESKATD